MKFLTIKDNKVVSTREGNSIVDEEIENIDNLECGMELIDGVWKIPVHVPTLEDKKQEYIRLISDASILGDDAEVTRLRTEWQSVKAKFTT